MKKSPINSTYDQRETAVRLIAYLDDFDGNVEKWKDSFYNLWRHQMTFGFAYEISVHDTLNNGVFVDVLCREQFAKIAKETMEDLGYRKIESCEEQVGIVFTYERKDCEDITAIYMD